MEFKKYIFCVMLLCLSILLDSLSSQAQEMINYQGKLISKGIPANGFYALHFAIYESETSLVPLWQETHDTITVNNGIFNVLLGKNNSFPSSLFNSSNGRYLGITVGNEAEMIPRFRLTGVAYAIKSAYSDTAQYALKTNSSGGTGDGHSLDSADGSVIDAVYVAKDGRVGIGTTTPTGSKLTIISQDESGGLYWRQDGGIMPGAKVRLCNNNGRGGLYLGGSSILNFENTTGGWEIETENENFKFNLGTGKVGIDTLYPQAKLHIGGIPGMDGIMFPDGTLQTTAATGGGGTGDGHSLNAADGNPQDALFVDNDGKVGIGTTEPVEQLDVRGNIILNQYKYPHLTFRDKSYWMGVKAGNPFGINDPLIINKNSARSIIFSGGAQINGDQVSGGVAAMIIDPSNNVGIGTVNPTSKLHVVGDVKIDGPTTLQSIYSNWGFHSTMGSGGKGIVLALDDNPKGNSAPWIVWDTKKGTGQNSYFHAIHQDSDDLNFGRLKCITPDSGYLHIMTLKGSNGRVGINTYGPAARLDIRSTQYEKGILWTQEAGVATPGAYFCVYDNNASAMMTLGGTATLDLINTTGGWRFQTTDHNFNFNLGTGKVGIGTVNPTEKLHVDGNILATGTITEGSSREYKENIGTLSVQEALEALTNLNPVKYNYKNSTDNEQYLGFIAEEVPALVATQDRKSLRSMDIVAVLTKIVQEQQQLITDLKAKIDKLEEKVK